MFVIKKIVTISELVFSVYQSSMILTGLPTTQEGKTENDIIMCLYFSNPSTSPHKYERS
jgi:hypothetical protein